MKKKPNPKETASLDKIIEANTNVKNAWIKIILELEKGKNNSPKK